MLNVLVTGIGAGVKRMIVISYRRKLECSSEAWALEKYASARAKKLRNIYRFSILNNLSYFSPSKRLLSPQSDQR